MSFVTTISLFLILPLVMMSRTLRGPEGSLCMTEKTEDYTEVVDTGVNYIKRWEKTPYCCNGFTEIDGLCVPNGKCTGKNCILPCDQTTGICTCMPGYTGVNCDRYCPEGSYGANCHERCKCLHGKCNHVDGSCTCNPGFTGVNCDRHCPEGTFGASCLERCNCSNGKCNHVDGSCNCYAGFTGKYCSQLCTHQSDDANCRGICLCQNNGECKPNTDECICLDGFFGKYCESQCDCGGYSCNKNTGDCQCPDGFIGKLCTEPCPSGRYGLGCSQICNCLQGECHSGNGTCTCIKNWTGRSCQCYEPNTKWGNVKCICKDGYMGDDCSKACPAQKFGQSCDENCNCDWRNTNGCDSVTGACICKTHWSGANCTECSCQNDGICDKYGGCTCSPGYYDNDCSKKCKYFGLGNFKCDHLKGDVCNAIFSGEFCDECLCENDGQCNKLTGSCDCKPGFYGLKCENNCPVGLFGEKCTEKCLCESCRSSDGLCPGCGQNSNLTQCQFYCQFDEYDKSAKKCLNISTSAVITVEVSKYTLVILAVSGGIVITSAALGTFLILKRRNRKPRKPFALPLPEIPKYEEEPRYEEIPEQIIPNDGYDSLLRSDELGKCLEPQYFKGYEIPKHVRPDVLPNKGSYIRLSRFNSGQHLF